MQSEGPGNKPSRKKRKRKHIHPSILTEMFVLLKIGIQKIRNMSVNSPNRCAS